MSNTHDDYGMFKTHLDSHTGLATTAEEVLAEEGNELDTPSLAQKIAEKKDGEMSESYCRSLLLEGREWIVENSEIEVEERSQETGGNPTVYWSLNLER
jgi:hypothetical protein